jgi:hypothetical protein
MLQLVVLHAKSASVKDMMEWLRQRTLCVF